MATPATVTATNSVRSEKVQRLLGVVVMGRQWG